jgi:hypothetical protein
VPLGPNKWIPIEASPIVRVRRRSAFALLGQIEVLRLENGRPDDERERARTRPGKLDAFVNRGTR